MEEEKENFLDLLDIPKIHELTGWSVNHIQKMMRDPEFPLIKVGKKNQVSKMAFKEYLTKRRVVREIVSTKEKEG